MTTDTIHTCSYSCERPGCIRAQRDELVAKVEALRAEVEAWRELSDHVRVGACKAIWPDRYVDERIRDVAAALKRAERLAEALKEIRSRSAMNLAMNPNPYELTALLGDIHQIADSEL